MKKLQVWIPLLFALVMIVGMIVGFNLRESIGNRGFFKPRKQTPVQEVIDLVNSKYVDSVNTDSLGEDAIAGMLAHLDPHSIFIPVSEIGEVTEDLQGNFEGIGIEFQVFNDTVNVVSVLPGGPSDKAGLQIGDKFIRLNDSLIAGNHTSRDRIKSLLRGPESSQVKIHLSRSGIQKDVMVNRGTIPLVSVDVSYMMDKLTGYIHINRFAATTYAEFMQAMEKLQKENVQKLILDLRGNGGGYVDQAVNIADEFLDQDKLIVYTIGRKSPRRDYNASRPGVFEKGKLVLLVDEGTASASEILTGALQDWDRATIVGRRTFGKGLVQEGMPLSDGSQLRLTVARYYTPIGRSIQKPYDKKDHEAYNEEVMNRFHDGEAIHGDTNNSHPGIPYKTKGGRTVYGGGGITPDIFIGFDTTVLSKNITTLYVTGIFNRFVYAYYMDHRDIFSRYKTAADFANGYHEDEKLWKSLSDFSEKDTIMLNFVPQRDKSQLLQRVKAQLARMNWRTEGFYEVSNYYDKVVAKALEEVNENR